MRAETSKRIACEFAVAMLVCGAVHYFVIAPTERQAKAIGGKVEALASIGTDSARHSTDQLRQMASLAHEQVMRVVSNNRIGEDQTELLSTITNLAESSGVRLDRFEPGERKQHAPDPIVAPTVTNAEPVALIEQDTTLTSKLNLSGSYEGIAKFIEVLETRAGCANVSTIRLTPTQKPGVLQADVSVEHHTFAVPVRFTRAIESPER